MTNLDFYRSAIDAPGCIGNGWNLVKNNYGMYLGIAIVGIILAGCIPCVSLFLVGPITGGIYYVVLREMRGEPIEFGMMFKGFDKFVPLMAIGIIQSVPEIIAQTFRVTADLGRLGLQGAAGSQDYYQDAPDVAPFAIASGVLVIVILVALAFVLFGMVWRVLLYFAIPLVLEHEMGVVDAIKLSARAAMGNVGGLILLFILEGLVMLLGLLMLCIGIFFVIPIIYAANAFAYRQVFPLMQQQFNMAPPPPQQYGGSFGQGM